jgi:hypothetical protein
MTTSRVKTFLKRVISFLNFHDVSNNLLLEISMGVEATSDLHRLQ